jgi:primary-amine oxidase
MLLPPTGCRSAGRKDILLTAESTTSDANASRSRAEDDLHRFRHPLDPLDAAEIGVAAVTVRDAHPELERPVFALIALQDPPKELVLRPDAWTRIERTASVVLLDRSSGETYEASVALEAQKVRAWRMVPGAQPPIMLEEFEIAERAARADERFAAALRRRGIDDPSTVQIDALTAGHFDEYPAGRRILWATPYLRERPDSNGYARPIENLRAMVDVSTGEVLEIRDGEVVPLSGAPGDYDEKALGGYRQDLRPLEIVQPHGPSFLVEGNTVRWQGWEVHAALHPVDGLVLSDIRYDGRQVLYRASIAEMVVPYGEPHDGYYWRSYFDAGEYGLGRMTNSLALGCDCLGEIYYFDAVTANSAGEPETIANAICLHEEDHGILWKHRDLATGASEVRRSRRLVLSNIATVGNYDYCFYWSLYQDGHIEFEAKLTGIVLTRGVHPDESLRHSNRIAPDLAAPHHQHLFVARLDMAVGGLANSVYEVDMVRAEDNPANPYGGAMEVRRIRIDNERKARRFIDPSSARTWLVVNETNTTSWGEPIGYKLVPHAGPLLLASEHSSVGRRAGFARAHVWVTRYAPDELHPAGEYPNQHRGGEGLPAWVESQRDLVDTDVVLWHTFGVSHAVRPEDWPVMPVEHVGFSLKPVAFFGRNPAIDLPPSQPPCCETKTV